MVHRGKFKNLSTALYHRQSDFTDPRIANNDFLRSGNKLECHNCLLECPLACQSRQPPEDNTRVALLHSY